MARKPKSSGKGKSARSDLVASLIAEMDGAPTAEALNDQVIQPFTQALEAVCQARGYVLNIYGEASNLVFSGDADAAEDIYAMVEDYLDSREKPED